MGIPGGSLDPYKTEVFLQCNAAAKAWNRAHEKLMTVLPPGTGEAVEHALDAVGDLQAFLVAAGILSDLFFPGDRGSSDRGEALRSLYQVGRESPLADSKVRNSFVHVDERLDRWLPLQAGRQVGPFSIDHWDGPAPPPERAAHLRIIDTRNWRILVRGESLDLRPLLEEIARIGTTVSLHVEGPGGPVDLKLGPSMDR